MAAAEHSLDSLETLEPESGPEWKRKLQPGDFISMFHNSRTALKFPRKVIIY